MVAGDSCRRLDCCCQGPLLWHRCNVSKRRHSLLCLIESLAFCYGCTICPHHTFDRQSLGLHTGSSSGLVPHVFPC